MHTPRNPIILTECLFLQNQNEEALLKRRNKEKLKR
jgi:N-acetylmuramoyl-L-alanine amidase